MNKQERQRLNTTIPKCKCGNNLSLVRQAEGITKCPSCDSIEQDCDTCANMPGQFCYDENQVHCSNYSLWKKEKRPCQCLSLKSVGVLKNFRTK